MTIDIDAYWEYSDPSASEERFRAALVTAQGDVRLELFTQIARTYSLRKRFEEAHELLDRVLEELDSGGPRPRARYLLERGRTFNSAGETEKAQALFLQAWDKARATELEGFAVDAAHMVAITHAGSDDAVAWNRRGLEIAHTAQDPKALALMQAILNNSAWDLHDMGRFDEALPLFEEALSEWTVRDKEQQISIARWSVARCLRSLERHEDALTILLDLEAAHAAKDSADGYVFEEIAENFAALNRSAAAARYFKSAFRELSNDDWLVQNEPARLARLKSLGWPDTR